MHNTIIDKVLLIIIFILVKKEKMNMLNTDVVEILFEIKIKLW